MRHKTDLSAVGTVKVRVFRTRAQQLRMISGTVREPAAKRDLLAAAAEYEAMAAIIERTFPSGAALPTRGSDAAVGTRQ